MYLDFLSSIKAKTISGTTICGVNICGGMTWNGSTANGVGTYVSATRICSQPNMTFNGSLLAVSNALTGTTTTQISFLTTGDGGQGGLIGLDTIDKNAYVRLNTGSNYRWQIQGTAGTPLMTLCNSGNVGIGTTNPTAKLHVSGDIIATGSYCSLTTGCGIILTRNSGSLQMKTLYFCNVTDNGVGDDVWLTNQGGGNVFLKANGNTGLQITSTGIACAPICFVSPIVCATTCFASPIVCATTCIQTPYAYVRKDVANGEGATLCLHNCVYSTAAGATTGIRMAFLDSRYACIKVIGCGIYGHVDKISIGLTDFVDDIYREKLSIDASTGSVTATGKVIAGTSCGFYNATFATGINPIWAFANANTYGMSYCQGSVDDIRIHFGSTSAPQFCFQSAGCAIITACGIGIDWIATSDCRLKTDIQPICNALSTVLCLQGVCYHHCDDETREMHLGLIAQDVQKVLPEVVSHGVPSENDAKYGITDEKLGLKYDKLSAVLIEAIKEQQKQLDCLCLELNCMRNSNK